MKRTICAVMMALLLGTASGVVAGGGGQSLPTPDGVLCPTPVLQRTCVAVKVPMQATEAMQGIRWYHNDGSITFPALLVGSGMNDVPPVYDQALSVATGVTGPTLDWTEVAFSEPVASQTEALYVIFQLPENLEQEAAGDGGGPGIGYVEEEGGPCVYLSSDGDQWVRLNLGCRLLVEPLLVEREPGMVALRAPVMDGQGRDQAPILETAFLSPYPNPFNPAVNLRFQLKEGGAVDLSIYDVRGRLVRHLVSGFAEKGSHVVEWNGRDEGGQAVASGVYLARMKAGGVRFTRRLLLVR